jgi:diguanylate cyclase (GGDEF)-like protein
VVSGRKGVSGFNADDVQLLEAIGAIGASALENAHLVSQIRHQATHDRLTSLPNQLLFEDRVNQAVQRARPLREKLAVLMIDLDDFQKVNASLGHAMGNELLKRVGGRLTGAVREGDTVARMSADDFTICFPVSARAGARHHGRAAAQRSAGRSSSTATAIHDFERRHRRVSGRRLARGPASAQRRHRDAPREGRRRQLHPPL